MRNFKKATWEKEATLAMYGISNRGCKMPELYGDENEFSRLSEYAASLTFVVSSYFSLSLRIKMVIF